MIKSSMRRQISLSRLAVSFWSGTVEWSAAASAEATEIELGYTHTFPYVCQCIYILTRVTALEQRPRTAARLN